MMKGGYLVRWFTALDGTEIEASLLKVHAGYRWRMTRKGLKSGFAFGSVCKSWEAGSELTSIAKMFGLVEHEEIT